MQLFYNPDLTEATKNFTFDREESKHIVKVLRKQEGDKLYVTNGLGFIFTAEIVIGMDTKCQVKITNIEKQKPLNYKLHLAVAPTKMNDRYEWFLEKATEIGVSSITPIICEHSERKHIKSDRFEKIIQRNLDFFRPVNLAGLEAADQFLGCQVDIHHFVRLLQNPVGNPFLHLNPRNLLHFAAQAFDVLDINRGNHINIGIK